MIDASDKAIWNLAKENDFSIVTLDSDFNDLNTLLGYPPKVIWLRIGNLRTHQISEILMTKEKEIANFISNPDLGILEITTS
jgi:predicted nuclease of predicted toxin-antitoxin system